MTFKRSNSSAGVIRSVLIAIALVAVAMSLSALPAQAEGTRDLIANGGYRPYTERYNATTQGEERQSVMHVYLRAGETVYLGTSVANAKLYNTSNGTNTDFLFSNSAMGKNYTNEQLTYINTADVAIAQGNYANIANAIAAGEYPGSGVTLVDLAADATNTTPGYIYNSVQEAGGIDFTGTGAGYKVTTDNTISPSTSGYVDGAKTNANTYTAPADGIYTVVFFSSAHTKENPAKCLASDTRAFTALQEGGTIASWDISVYSGNTPQTGRVFTSTLFLNMGGNVLKGGVSQGSLYSKVYAVTADGYRYKVDFNGMDPYGFVFFANNRGLLKTKEDVSLYHGVRSDNNYLNDIASHDVTLNNTPTTSQDATYNLFYESPSTEALSALNIKDPSTSGSITDFTFAGNENIGTTKATGTDEGYVGEGGTFSFTAPAGTTATSYEIDLNFGTDNTVVLSNTLVSGTNSITWNGKDAKGDIVPAGTYGTGTISVKLKGGEVHFPLLDVEQNPNGIKIGRINGSGASESSPDYTVYYNNSSLNAGDVTSPWTTEKNWEVGSQTDALSGVDSSSGAMAFTNVNTAKSAKGMNLLGDGDQCALDVWADYNTPAELGTYDFKLVDTSFTVTKAWANTAGTPKAGNPKVEMTLYDSDGVEVTADATGAAIVNPVTYDTAQGVTYEWEHLDPAKVYYVTETPLTGYAITNSGETATVTGDVANGFAQTITNTLQAMDISVAKVWNHGTQDQASWPTSVTVHLLANGTEVDSAVLTADTGWAHVFSGEPVCDTAGDSVNYTITEDAVSDYSSATTGNAANGFTVTNTYNPPATPVQPLTPVSVSPTSDSPSTGDQTASPWVFVLIAAGGAAVIYAALRMRKKK